MVKNIIARAKDDKGAVLVITLCLMIIVALIGFAGITMTTVDLKSSGKDRLDKSAFYAADAGVEIVPEVVDYYVENLPEGSGYPDNLDAAFQPIMQDQYFLNEVMGYGTNNDGTSDSTNSSPDVELAVAGRDVEMDIDRFHTQHSVGHAAESLLGYEGVGSGLGGGAISIYYRSTSKGNDVRSTNSSIEVVYRYVY